MPDRKKVHRCQVRCLCGDSIVIKADNPVHLHGLNVICGGCGLFLGRIIGRELGDGYLIRLLPHEELTEALGVPEPTWAL